MTDTEVSSPQASAPNQTAMPRRSSGKRSGLIPVLALTLAAVGLASIIALVLVFLGDAKKISDLTARVATLETNSIMTEIRFLQLEQKRVDLTVKSFQNLGGNFGISIESVDPHLTGVTIKGAILNENSTRRTDVKFNITVGKSKQGLSIPAIPSGYATKFELYVPDVAKEETKTASVEFESSNVSYSISQ